MALMALGLIIWTGIHLFPSLAPTQRQRVIERIGEAPYKGLFALLILVGLILIVVGWRSSVPSMVYVPPIGLRHPAMLLVVIAFILFAASHLPTRIKRYIRHPQLAGVALWALAHLMANGDSRSVLLFTVLGIWALVSMVTLNRRDGVWIKPGPPAVWREAIPVVAGVLVAAIVVKLHPYLSGVSLIG